MILFLVVDAYIFRWLQFLSKLAPLSFIKSLIFLYFNVLRPHILLLSIFSFVYLAPLLSFCSFFFLNFDAPFCLTYILPFLLSHRPSVLYYCAFLFVLCGAPSFTFVAVCLRLYIPIFLYFNVLRPHILLISIFLCLFGAPPFFHFFFLFSILTPLFAYLIFYHSYYLTALPFCIILLSFLCFAAPLPSPLLLFVYTFIFPFLPFWRFWAFSYNFFLLNLFPFVTFFIFLSLSFHFMSPLLFFFPLFLSLFFFFPLSPSLFFFFPLPLFPLLFFFLFLTPLLVTFWRPLVAIRGASARYAPPQDTPLLSLFLKIPTNNCKYLLGAGFDPSIFISEIGIQKSAKVI